MSKLGDKLLAVHHSLDANAIAHAFGGAIALAYCTQDPRGTSDLDVNIFVPPSDSHRVLSSLPAGIMHTRQDAKTLERDGQIRLWWDRTPIDIFLNTHPFHEQAATETRHVPFEGDNIPILSCHVLAVFKAMFDRSKDWVDIEQMVQADAVQSAVVAASVHDILGNDSRVTRLLTLNMGGPRLQPKFPPALPTPQQRNQAPKTVAVCGAWMPRSKTRCSLPLGHDGHHRP